MRRSKKNLKKIYSNQRSNLFNSERAQEIVQERAQERNQGRAQEKDSIRVGARVKELRTERSGKKAQDRETKRGRSEEPCPRGLLSLCLEPNLTFIVYRWQNHC